MAAADLGICCHTSASGLDLPMKIADMFGAGIPVCAFDYGPCLRELVHPGVNGVLFTTAEDCCAQLEGLLAGSPGSNAILAALKGGVRESAATSWSAGWAAEARARCSVRAMNVDPHLPIFLPAPGCRCPEINTTSS